MSDLATAPKRMRKALLEYFAAADAAVIDLCQEASKLGITSIPIRPAQAKALDAYNALRSVLEGQVVTIETFKVREQDADIEQLRAAVADLLCGWRYIRQSHGDLYGVGWDRAQVKAEKALGIGPGAPVPEDCLVLHNFPLEPSPNSVWQCPDGQGEQRP